jgi:hypothetical protein
MVFVEANANSPQLLPIPGPDDSSYHKVEPAVSDSTCLALGLETAAVYEGNAASSATWRGEPRRRIILPIYPTFGRR